jgi:hypothetical protein
MDVDEEVQPMVEMAMKILVAVALGSSCPLPLLLLGLGAGVEEVLPLLGGFQREGFSSQWTGAYKVGFPSIYRGGDAILAIGWMPFDPRVLGRL